MTKKSQRRTAPGGRTRERGPAVERRVRNVPVAVERRRGPATGGRRRKSHRPSLWATLGVLAGVVVLLAVAVLYFSGQNVREEDFLVRVDDGRIHVGVTLDGIDVSGLLPEEAVPALEKGLKEKMDGDTLTLIFGSGEDAREEKLPLSAIGVITQLEGAVDRAMKTGRSGGIDGRIGSLTPELLSLTLDSNFDEAKLPELIKAALATVDFLPSEPTALLDPVTHHFSYTPGKEGLVPDESTLVTLITHAVKSGERTPIPVPGTPVEPQYTLSQIQANTKLISSYSTTYDYVARGTTNRHFNINLMCEKVNGAQVLPGEIFSLNDRVGPRTDPKIWKAAIGIENGAYTDQLGGGICQYSSTMFNAVIMADMQVTERRPHSIPSAYIAMGRDAAINTGGPDLKVKNNSDLPVYIISYTRTNASNNKKRDVVVEIYGKPLADGMTIAIEAKTTETLPHDPTPKIITDPKYVVNGRDGYRAEMTKVYKDKAGKVIKREIVARSTYNPASPRTLATPSPSPSLSPTPTAGTPSPSPGTTPAVTPASTPVTP